MIKWTEQDVLDAFAEAMGGTEAPIKTGNQLVEQLKKRAQELTQPTPGLPTGTVPVIPEMQGR